MRIVDIFALLGYILTILNLIYLIPALMKYFYGRIKAQIVTAFVAVVFVILVSYGIQMCVGLWSRYVTATTVTPESFTTVRTYLWTIGQDFIALCMTFLSWLMHSGNTNKFIVFGKNRKGE